MAAISNTASLLAGVIDSWSAFECCNAVGPWTCTRSLLIIVQYSLSFLNYYIIYAFIAAWIKETSAESRQKFLARLTFTLYNLWFVVGATLLTAFFVWAYGAHDDKSRLLFTIFGYIALATILLQWLPQIWTTFKMRSSGTLSPFTLILNMVGCAAVIFVAIASGNSPLTWVAYAASAAQQAVLLVMLLIFWLANRKNKQNADASHIQDDEATRSLLGGGMGDGADSGDLSSGLDSRGASFSGDELTPTYRFYNQQQHQHQSGGYSKIN